MQSTLKQFVRDWSTEGLEERNTCYKPIIDEILKEFPLESYVLIMLNNFVTHYLKQITSVLQHLKLKFWYLVLVLEDWYLKLPN